MDKSLLTYIAIGLGGLYFLTNFVGGIQDEDDRLKNDEYNTKHQFDEYHSSDSIGQNILDLTGADTYTQINAWQESNLKHEFLALFPNFSEMKSFIEDRIRGEALKTKLRSTVNKIEDQFLSGNIHTEQAKRQLSSLK
jgi:hypothetical protein